MIDRTAADWSGAEASLVKSRLAEIAETLTRLAASSRGLDS